MNNTFYKTNQELECSLLSLRTKEKEVISHILKDLLEVAERKLYLEQGMDSLFTYCRKKLGYTESESQLRVSGVKALSELGSSTSINVRETLKKVESGSISLSNLSSVNRVIKAAQYESKAPLKKSQKLEVLKSFEGKSIREAEDVLQIKYGSYFSHNAKKKDIYARQAENEYRLSFTVDQKTFEEFQKFKKLTSHKNPFQKDGVALSNLLAIALPKVDLLAQKQKKSPKKTSTITNTLQGVSRLGSFKEPWKNKRGYIKIEDKRAVLSRAAYQCEYVSPFTGNRCENNYQLQYDHVLAVAKNGGSNRENLQLLCRAHNMFKGVK